MSIRKRRATSVPGGSWVVATAAAEEVDPPLARAPGGQPLDAYDLALLNGGPELAVTVALVALEVRNVITCGQEALHELVDGGSLTYTGLRADPPADAGAGFVARTRQAPPGDLHPVERTVYDEVAAGTAPDRLPAIRDAVLASPAVEAARSRLVQLGFRRPTPYRAAVRRRVRWVQAGLLAGAVPALLLAFEAGHPFPLYPMIVALTTERELVRLTMRRHPDHRLLLDARATHPRARLGPDDAPLGRVPDLWLLVALHGDAVLWDHDPVLACALWVPLPRTRGWWGPPVLDFWNDDDDRGDGDGDDGDLD